MFPESAVYVNRQPDRFARELAEAQSAGIEGASAGSVEFERVIALGEQLVYVVLVDGVLRICEKIVHFRQVHHSVIAVGEPVLAAGEVSVVVSEGIKYVIELNGRSGHYLPDPKCLAVARRAFEDLGFVVPDGAVAP